MGQHFDVVIIGSGAGGATLAQRLAPTGKSILILERGEHLPREAENWSPKAVFIQHRYRTKEQWYDKARQAVHAQHPLLGRRQHHLLWRGPDAAARSATSRRCSTRAGSRRPGRSA